MSKIIYLSLVYILLAGCASSFKLTNNAELMRNQMSQPEAEKLLASFVKPNNSRGGLCLVGIHTSLTRLNYDFPVTVAGTMIDFSAFYASPGGTSVQGNITSGTGQVSLGYRAEEGRFSVDARTLHEVRILNVNRVLLALCHNFKPGFMVVLKPSKNFPDQAEIGINATSQDEIDSILAVLTYLSPKARLVTGVGM